MIPELKAFYKRICCLFAALVLMVVIMPSVTPNAQASIDGSSALKIVEEMKKGVDNIIYLYPQLKPAVDNAIYEVQKVVQNGGAGVAAAAGSSILATSGLATAGLAALGVALFSLVPIGMKAAGMEYQPAPGITTGGVWYPTHDGWLMQTMLTLGAMGADAIEALLEKAVEIASGAESVVLEADLINDMKRAFGDTGVLTDNLDSTFSYTGNSVHQIYEDNKRNLYLGNLGSMSLWGQVMNVPVNVTLYGADGNVWNTFNFHDEFSSIFSNSNLTQLECVLSRGSNGYQFYMTGFTSNFYWNQQSNSLIFSSSQAQSITFTPPALPLRHDPAAMPWDEPLIQPKRIAIPQIQPLPDTDPAAVPTPEEAARRVIQTIADINNTPYPNIVSDPNANTNPQPKPDPDPDTKPELPETPAHFHLFPFCIPFDVVNMIKGLRETPTAPRWEIPLALPTALAAVSNKTEEIITVDLSFLEDIMPFVRMMILLMFVFGLAKATSMFIKW